MGRAEHGQATMETILLAWIAVAFFAAVIQLFIVNDSIYKSLAAVHREHFVRVQPHNCTDGGDSDCKYSYDHARVTWRAPDFPEIRVPVLPLFQAAGRLGVGSLPAELPIHNDDGSPKRTEMASGPAGPRRTIGLGEADLAEKVAWMIQKGLEDFDRILQAGLGRYSD